jgi:CHAD domain-containing protein
MDGNLQHEEKQLTELLLPLLKKYREKFHQTATKIKDETASETVHDLRVSIRRLRALITLFNDISSKLKPKAFNRALRRLLKPYGSLRDQYIQMNILKASVSKDEQFLNPYLDRLNKKVAKLEIILKKRIKTIDLSEVEDLLGRLINLNKIQIPRNKRPHGAVEKSIPFFVSRSILQKFLIACFAYLPLISKEELKQDFHKLRVAVKKLRYKVEILQPLLSQDYSEEAISIFRQIQDAMGETHDRDVAMDDVTSFFRKKDPNVLESPAYKKWLENMGAERHKYYKRSLELLKQLEKVNFFHPEKPAKSESAAGSPSKD